MSIQLDQVSKFYGGRPAIADVSVEIEDGEFFVLLGPSGSGKSTLLRAIAGLTAVDRGRIVLHGHDVTHVNARRREVGFVFQNYALFRHMSVADNVEFALCARRVKAAARKKRREQLLELVSLEGLGDRLPSQLSGGQQQRVAVARALAHEPRVLLLDEPFGALDAVIRDDLRRGIREIQQRIGITAILVTHDQEEAFAMADRIGVMDHGRLQETGEPRRLYREPATRFVATFLGTANLFLGRADGAAVQVGEARLAHGRRGAPRATGEEVTVVARPENMEIAPERERLASAPLGAGTVREIRFIGSTERLRIELDAGPRLWSAADPGAVRFTVDVARPAAGSVPVQVGDRVWVGCTACATLPTPVGSLRIAAAPGAARERLLGLPLVRDLARRMQVTPVPVDDAMPAALPGGGLTLVSLDAIGALDRDIDHATGATRQLLAVSAGAGDVERMLICTDGSAQATVTTLATASSIARHLTLDATLLVAAGDGGRASDYRRLLDLRDDSLRRNRLDVQTEHYTGTLSAALSARRQHLPKTLLVVGAAGPAERARLLAEISPALTATPYAGAANAASRRGGAWRLVGSARDVGDVGQQAVLPAGILLVEAPAVAGQRRPRVARFTALAPAPGLARVSP